MSKAVAKYLAAHAEASAGVGAAIAGLHAHAVVIPAYGEGTELDRALASVPGSGEHPTLAVVVLNRRADSPPWVSVVNRQTATRLEKRYPRRASLAGETWLHAAPFGTLAILHRTLPAGQGVGLARKHGHDFVLGAWAAGKLRSPWLHCTDADVQLPEDYFTAPASPAVATLAPFRHVAKEAALGVHGRIYDTWLRYRVLGLNWARSPYAFHSIGSTIAVHAAAYAAVRGFPRRNAAEDFYLLNKLAKVGPVVRSPTSPIRITARLSERVPFGTGRALRDAISDGCAGRLRFYHPHLFAYLQALIRSCELSLVSAEPMQTTLHEMLTDMGLPSAPLVSAIGSLGVEAGLETARRSASVAQRRLRAFHTWLDAFRTMKLLHHLRDHAIASVDIQELPRVAGFLLQQQDESVTDDLRLVGEALADLSWTKAAADHRSAQ